MLWFEPERVFENSDIAKKHPEWLLKCDEPDEWYKKNALLNLAIPECVDFITDTVDAIIKENHVTILLCVLSEVFRVVCNRKAILPSGYYFYAEISSSASSS